MADKYLSKITLVDGTVVKIKDTEAREAIKGGTHFLGATSTSLADGSSTNPITIGSDSVTAKNGDIVVSGNKEFIFATIDNKWHELGDITGLGALALKNSASGSYTPEGTVSFSGGTVESTGTYTPEGTVSFSGGTVESTGTYTPQGSVSKPAIDVTPSAASIKEFDQAGSVTAGSAASCTLPTFSATYDESTENLTLGWTAGSFVANVPTAVTLPTSKETSVLTGVAAELHEAPTFSGTEASINVEGTAAGTATFSGTEASINVEGTAAGSATFSGTPATITVE